MVAGGYIFPLRKSDKVSQPSAIGTVVLITDNGSRGWGLGGDFYFKQDTYHITTIYFRGNINSTDLSMASEAPPATRTASRR